jgi:hypothetical protein
MVQTDPRWREETRGLCPECLREVPSALILGRYALLAVSGLAALFYVLAGMRGVTEWRCWAKPPWVTLFCAWQTWRLAHGLPLPM